MVNQMSFFRGFLKLLVIVGAVNWGLIGALDFNLVSYLFKDIAYIPKIVYIIVGGSGLLLLNDAFQEFKYSILE